MGFNGFLLIKPKTQPNHRQKVGFFHPCLEHIVLTIFRVVKLYEI